MDERSVCRIKEGTPAEPLQSGLDEKRWVDFMESYCYGLNVEDLLENGKTPYERTFGEPFTDPVIPFGATAEYRPISVKDLSRFHQFG